ncbi:MAG: heme biosynthesis protein HemY [Methylobacteriaceae bacterium]|nr:heme biosynthesis protein HemY [Methylobacteriaceae bacterium]
MWRLIVFLAVLAALAFGVAWLADQPGDITLAIPNYVTVHTSLFGAVGAVLAAAVVLSVLWSALRLVFRMPSIFNYARNARRRRKGYDALTRGMVAAGAGDARAARKAANEASRHLPREPLSMLLNAQVAQLNGDRVAAEAAFAAMAKREETKLLGLRGLHIEAQRRGDDDAANHFAREAHRIAALPWAGEAVVSQQAAQSDWEGALATVEANARAKAIDAATAQRERAVLETAIAQERELTDPEGALKLATSAAKRAPDLVPATALAARLLTRRGSLRTAAKMIEQADARAPPPVRWDAYLVIRGGDSSADRYARAKTLARLAPDNIESRLMLARAALATRDFGEARKAIAPLVEGDARPSARVCVLMAEIEEAQFGESGAVREWLARGSRAPRDPAWIADGVVSSRWSPVSPVTGKLDAFRWTTPVEQIGLAAPEPVIAPMPDTAPKTIEPLAIEPPAEPEPSAEPVEEAKIEPVVIEPPPAARPVVFPLPNSPDDPGAEPENDTRRRAY